MKTLALIPALQGRNMAARSEAPGCPLQKLFPKKCAQSPTRRWLPTDGFEFATTARRGLRHNTVADIKHILNQKHTPP